MDIGVRLRFPHPGAFGESEGKKVGVRAGQNEPKFLNMLGHFGENSSRFEGK